MFHFSWAGLRSAFICHIQSSHQLDKLRMNNKQKHYRMQTKCKVFRLRLSIDPAYVFVSWLMVVIIHGSLFLERFAQCRCSGNHGGGRKKHAKTKVGRKRLPGFRQNCMRIGLCPEDEWWAIYFAGFLLMLCHSIQTKINKWRFLLTPMMHGGGGGFVCTVCGKWRTTKL